MMVSGKGVVADRAIEPPCLAQPFNLVTQVSRREEVLKNKHLFLLFSLIAILGVALAGCAPATQAPVETEAPPEETEEMEETEAPTEEPTPVATEEMEPELGSEERPIQVLFVPSVEAGVITTGGEIMAEALNEATGLTFEVSVPTSYAATIEAMCASPGDTVAIPTTAGGSPALGAATAPSAPAKVWRTSGPAPAHPSRKLSHGTNRSSAAGANGSWRDSSAAACHASSARAARSPGSSTTSRAPAGRYEPSAAGASAIQGSRRSGCATAARPSTASTTASGTSTRAAR